MNKLDHPNILQLYEIYEADDSFCLIMEYMKGGNLEDWLEANLSSLDDRKIKIILKALFLKN